jgi:hypothetical protein
MEEAPATGELSLANAGREVWFSNSKLLKSQILISLCINFALLKGEP